MKKEISWSLKYKNMRIYEITYLLKPTLSKEELIKTKEKVKDEVLQEGGLLVSEEEPRKVRLGYEIKDFKEAFLGVIRFSAKPQVSLNIENRIKRIESVLRFLIERNELYEKRMRKIDKKEGILQEEKDKKVEINLAELDQKLKEVLGEKLENNTENNNVP